MKYSKLFLTLLHNQWAIAIAVLLLAITFLPAWHIANTFSIANRLESMGVSVRWLYDIDSIRINRDGLIQDDQLPELIGLLGKCDRMSHVSISGVTLSQEMIDHLGSSHVSWLDYMPGESWDEMSSRLDKKPMDGLVKCPNLSKFKDLTILELSNCHIDSSNIVEIASLPKVDTIAFRFCFIEQEALMGLSHLKSLRFLRLLGSDLDTTPLEDIKAKLSDVDVETP